MATKKTAAKKPGTANAMKAAAKWRADVDAHASGAEIAITKGLPNDALGLYVRWRIAEIFATASGAGFPIDQQEADRIGCIWDLFAKVMRLVEHAMDGAAIRATLEAERWTAGTWLRVRNAFDNVVNIPGLRGVPPAGLMDMGDAMARFDFMAEDVGAEIEGYIADHPEIAEVEAFSRMAERQASSGGVNTGDALAVRDYLMRARAQYTSARVRNKKFNGELLEIPEGENGMLDEMRADGNEIGMALAYIEEAKRLREAAGLKGRPRNANGSHGITLSKKVNAAAVKVIENARSNDGYLGDKFDVPNMCSRRQLGKWCDAVADKLALETKLTPSLLASRNRTPDEKWNEFKRLISAMKF